MITSINLQALSSAIMASVERLWTYYKETYQEDEGDD